MSQSVQDASVPPSTRGAGGAARGRLGWKKCVGYGAVTVLVFFAVLEVALRLVGFRFLPGVLDVQVNGELVGTHYRQVAKQRALPTYAPEGQYVHDPRMIWAPLAGAPPFNRQGFIGPELPRARAGKLRIACLGDSCTQLGSPPYPALLQELLSRRLERGVEVLNAGVLGYSTFQGLLRLEHDVLAYRPDVVTIYFGWNDHWSIYPAPDAQLARDRRQPWFGWVDYLGWSRTVQAGLWLAVAVREATARDSATEDQQSYVLRVPPAEYSANLRRMLALCRSHGAEPILITAPTTLVPGSTPPGMEKTLVGEAARLFPSLAQLHEAYVEATRQTARDTGAALVDAFRAFGDGKGLIERDYIHLTREGRQRIAELVGEAIAREVTSDE